MEILTGIAFVICIGMGAWLFGSATAGTIVLLVQEKRRPEIFELGGIFSGVIYACVLSLMGWSLNVGWKPIWVLVSFCCVVIVAAWCSLRARSVVPPCGVQQNKKQQVVEGRSHKRLDRIRSAISVGGLTFIAFAFVRTGAEHGERVFWVFVPWSQVLVRIPFAMLMGIMFGLIWFWSTDHTKR